MHLDSPLKHLVILGVTVLSCSGCIEPASYRPGSERDVGVDALGDAAADVRDGGGGIADIGRDLSGGMDADDGGTSDVEGGDVASDASAGVYYRKKLTVTRSDWTEDVPGFVVLVSGEDDDIANTASRSDHIRFVGLDESVLPHRLIDYRASSGRLEAWVRIPALRAGQKTAFWIEFADDSFDPPDDVGEVWEGFAGVWHLDGELKDGDAAVDRSPNDNHGQVHGVSASARVPGRVGTAMQFDGVDNRVVIPANSTLEPTSSITMSAWVQVGAAPGSIISRPATVTTPGYGNSYQLWTSDSGKLTGTLSVDGNNTSVSSSGVPLNTWHHVAVTWDGSGMRHYLDGELQLTTQLGGTIDYDPDDVYLGVDKNVDSDSGPYVHMPLQGVIDEAWMRPDAASTTRIEAWVVNQSQARQFLQWGPLKTVSE